MEGRRSLSESDNFADLRAYHPGVGRRARDQRKSIFERVSKSVADYTGHLTPDEVRDLVGRDAPHVYSVLLRDRTDRLEGKTGIRRFFRITRLLFDSISEKLSPPRRLLFVASFVLFLLGLAKVRFTITGPPAVAAEADTLFLTLAFIGMVYLLAAELVEKVLVRDELQVARQLQSELLPHAPPSIEGWAIAHSSRTANDIGGDYHQFYPLADGRWAIVVADASGHGMAAGLLMAIADTCLRIAIDLDPSPQAVAPLVHRALLRAGDRRAFLTLFYGVLDPATGQLDWVDAGHPSPILRRADGELEEPVPGSLPLGLREKLEPARGALEIGRGELLVLFSDGLFESVGPKGDAFGHERLRAELATATSAAEAHDRLRAAVERHLEREPLADDLTIVVLERSA